ncbi:hypothetical protein KY285_009048 [Solanum tuberosum]|nr:hypothetical protein KY285_009048 [Solanum tuberosum]
MSNCKTKPLSSSSSFNFLTVSIFELNPSPKLLFFTPHRPTMHSYRLKTQNNSLSFKRIVQTRPTPSRPPTVRYNSSTNNCALEHNNNWYTYSSVLKACAETKRILVAVEAEDAVTTDDVTFVSALMATSQLQHLEFAQ